MPTYTTNYGLSLPLVNSAVDQDLWGGELNDNTTSIDSLIYTATNWVKRIVTGTDTATIADRNVIILGDATSASYVQTLPSAATVGNGFAIAFVKTDATTNTISVARAGSDTIGLSTSSFVISAQNEGLTLISDGVSNWNYQSKIVTPQTLSAATKAEQETATSTTVYVSPGRQQYHPSSPKAWVQFDGTTGTIRASYNVTSVTKNATGDYTINFTVPFSSANYAFSGMAGSDLSVATSVFWVTQAVSAPTASAFRMGVHLNFSGAYDASYVSASFFGDQ